MPPPLNASGVRTIVNTALRQIDGVELSAGALGTTVLLHGKPQLTITPMRGQWLLQSRTTLQVEHRGDILRRQKSSDADWDTFVAATGVGVSSFVYQAAAPIAAQSELHQRRRKLDLSEVEFDPDRPLHWRQLALWVEATGELDRNAATWSRRYATYLAKGRPRSDQFRRWADTTAQTAQARGFRPTAESLDDDEERPQEVKETLAIAPPLASLTEEVAQPLPSLVVQRLRVLRPRELQQIGDLHRSGETVARRNARAKAIRFQAGHYLSSRRAAFLEAFKELKESQAASDLPWDEILAAGLDALRAEAAWVGLDRLERDALSAAWYLGDPPRDA